MWQVLNGRKLLYLINISSDNERHEVAKLCKVLQILAQSSLSLISDFVRTQSGRQDSNLRPSAPKALDRVSEALGFQSITKYLLIHAWFVRKKLASFDVILTEFTQVISVLITFIRKILDALNIFLENWECSFTPFFYLSMLLFWKIST